MSGNVECFEFDDRAAYDAFRTAALGIGLGPLVDRLERGYCEDTPNGGIHWLYRCVEIGGNTKLAQRPTRPDEQKDEHDRIKVLIETRGEGGFVITAPSNGTVHPTGRAYALRSGGFASIDTITSDERRALFQLARSFDQMPRQQRRERREREPVADGDRPGDDFAARVSWAEILEPAGWRHLYDHGDTAYWQRPGKDGPGPSATVNHAGTDLFYVFSTSTPFDDECSVTKFGAYTVLNHGGDFSAAAKALAAQGYGKALPGVQQDLAHTNVGPSGPSDRSEREPEAGPPDVETTLAQCNLADIPTPPSAANMAKLEDGLRRLRTVLEAADPLRIAAVRGALVVKCQVAKVPSSAALIDSALAPLKKTAAEQNQRDLELFPNDEPWPNAVDGVALLDDLRDVLRQHVVLPAGADTAIPLWCIHTHLMDCWDVSPFLLISSPVWRCGKSTLADFVAGFSHRQLISSNTSDAALYRCIEKFAPTLILDEADSWLKLREELRGILNSGHKRSGAKVLRAEGDTHEPRVFSTWAAKVLALIGRPPATIGDRSIDIPMRRKTKQERVKRIREKKLRALCEPRRRQCARWADDRREVLSTAEPVLPYALTDRAQDNWAALIAIADEVGGSWPRAARDAALLLSNSAAQEEPRGVDLLIDIKSIFDQESPPDDFLPTETILDTLCKLEDRPWGTWGRQDKPMKPQALASLLKPFGPKPCNKRVGGAVLKGYYKVDFLESWERYAPVPPDPGDQAATSLQPNEYGGKPQNPVRYTPPDVADAHTEVSPMNTGENGDCSGVAARKPESGEDGPRREVLDL